jgi:outer membrane PBP1 activator LpoA protein
MQPTTRARSLRTRFCLLATVLAMALSACASLPPPLPPPGAAGWPASADQPGAAAAARQGDHARAAGLYEQAAASRALPERTDLELLAAHEWLAAGRATELQRVLAMLPAAPSPAQAYERSLLEAEEPLLTGGAQTAWQRMLMLPEPPSSSPPGTPQRYFALRERIALSAGRPVDAVRAELGFERVAGPSGQRAALRLGLLAGLREARDRGVKLDSESIQDQTVRGWLELAEIANGARARSLGSDAAFARWRERYPNHPAMEILAQTEPLPLAGSATHGQIALLLPLGGAAAPQSATVRDGFLSAYYQLPSGQRPPLHLYDTSVISVSTALAEARSAGASVIVGPLTREEVIAVADSGAQPVPVLALNFLPADRGGPAEMFQFALSPEDEARQVARRILADGHRRGIVVIPHGDWGARVLEAFTRELQAGGGSLLGEAEYDPAGHDYGAQLRGALRIDDSDLRHERLQTVLGTRLNFEPRRRADMEFIFVAPATATNARLIEPQLRYFYAGDVPTYTLSNAYEPDSTASNEDIDGLRYPDMPWMINDDAAMDELRSSVQQAWADRTSWRTRLFAFGYDACQLMLAIGGPRHDPADVQIDGLTGQLRFDAERRVQRELIWVQIRNGEPRRLAAPAAD